MCNFSTVYSKMPLAWFTLCIYDIEAYPLFFINQTKSIFGILGGYKPIMKERNRFFGLEWSPKI